MSLPTASSALSYSNGMGGSPAARSASWSSPNENGKDAIINYGMYGAALKEGVRSSNKAAEFEREGRRECSCRNEMAGAE